MGTPLKFKSKPCWSGVRQAAKNLGCTPAHLSMVLNGRRRPGKVMAERLKKLGVKYTMAANYR